MAALEQLGRGTTGTATKRDQQSKGLKALLNASIAADGGGNERGVNDSKRCGFIKRGARLSYQRWMLVHSMMSGTVLVFSDKLHVVQFYK